MTQPQHDVPPPAPRKISLDWWAVITALVLAALILLGIIPPVMW